MDPISSADRVIALLRQRLIERAKKNAGSAASAPQAQAVRPDSISAPNEVEPGDERRQRRRALIEAILIQDLGDSPINDASFQQLVDRVLGAIESDPHAATLLGRAVNRAGVA